MAPHISFVAYVKLYPAIIPAKWGQSKRTERIRELQRLGDFIYASLAKNPDPDVGNDRAVWIATPGGSAHRNYGLRGAGGQPGVAVKPGFGATPPQATIVGFFSPYYQFNVTDGPAYLNDEPSYTQPQPSWNYYSNEYDHYLTGFKSQTCLANPDKTVANEVYTLKTNLEAYITAGLPGGVQFNVFRIFYKGVTFGDRGLHFPQYIA